MNSVKIQKYVFVNISGRNRSRGAPGVLRKATIREKMKPFRNM